MSVNNMPIFPNLPKLSWGTASIADVIAAKNHDGTSGGATCIFTSGVNGSRIDEISVLPLGTNVVTVLRIFINNGSAPTTAINNSLYIEATIPANAISEVVGGVAIKLLNKDSSALVLPPNYKLYAVVGTTIATPLQVNVIGGDY